MPIIYFTNNYNNNDTIVFQRFDGSSLISPDASDYGGRKVDWEVLPLFVWRLLPDMLSIIIASTNAKQGLDTTSSILLLLLVTSFSTHAEIWASIPTIVPPC